VKLARDGLTAIAACVFMAAGGMLIAVPLGLFFLAVLLLLLWFYRDPDRMPPKDESLWVSPADGRVMEIGPAEHPFTGPALCIGIFMSPLDVHVNRSPTGGTIEFLDYVPGKRLAAYHPKASMENERFYVGMETSRGRTLLVQIAGLLARRIASRVKRGDVLTRGQRYGMIKLGSKVEVYLPASVRPLVKVGDRVRAGETPIGGHFDETIPS
jgi:phosphatidylserine decarboxylase